MDLRKSGLYFRPMNPVFQVHYLAARYGSRLRLGYHPAHHFRLLVFLLLLTLHESILLQSCVLQIFRHQKQTNHPFDKIVIRGDVHELPTGQEAFLAPFRFSGKHVRALPELVDMLVLALVPFQQMPAVYLMRMNQGDAVRPKGKMIPTPHHTEQWFVVALAAERSDGLFNPLGYFVLFVQQ